MAHTYQWSELTTRQQKASKMLAKSLGKKGWAATPVQVGRYFRAAMLWRGGGMSDESFARLIGATPHPRFDLDLWLPRRLTREEEQDTAASPGEAAGGCGEQRLGPAGFPA